MATFAHQIPVVGGGTAEISVAARLLQAGWRHDSGVVVTPATGEVTEFAVPGVIAALLEP